jgi:Tfp pilus assembly protein PilV
MFKRGPKSAFSLIECMIYLVIFMIIAHTLISFITCIYKKHISANNTIHCILQLYSASDKLVNDIHNALADTIRAKNIDTVSFYINTAEHVRWYIKNNTLLRASRRYTVAQKKWSQNAISVAAQHVHAMEVNLTQKGDYVESIMIKLASPYLRHTLSLYISPSSERI